MTDHVNGNVLADEGDSVRAETPSQRLQKAQSLGSSPLTSLGATPSPQNHGFETRPHGVYDDNVPANPFWVEINPKAGSFNRDEYIVDEEEFRIVGIYADRGEGDDVSYECHFEDDHFALV